MWGWECVRGWEFESELALGLPLSLAEVWRVELESEPARDLLFGVGKMWGLGRLALQVLGWL